MNGKLKTTLIAGGAAVIGIAIGAAGGNGGSTTAATPSTSTVTVSVPAPAAGGAAPVTVTKTVTATPTAAAGTPPAGGSTCDAVKEAILTGSQSQIDTAMKALQNDTSADSTAREYARYYLVRDTGQKDIREMDLSLIQTSCG